MSQRVLVAMSGGVDSAVAAALLHRQGYDVVGVTMRLYTEADDTALRSGRTCCGIEDVADARAAAQVIGIPHYVLNLERDFEQHVLTPFVEAYAQGRTPNPCLNCNQYVKFDTLLARAVAMGVDLLATGHYARVAADGEVHRMYRAVDQSKDQSYVLYTLGQDALHRTLFPLGDMTKAEVRAVARELALPLADKADSVDICFVPGGDYRKVLGERGVQAAPGAIERDDGERVGTHRGVPYFTVGQRRGLGIATAEPVYVTGLDAERNVVVIGGEGDLYARRLEASAPRWVVAPPATGEPLTARIRYRAEDALARVVAHDGAGFAVEFESRVRAPAPGQAIVLYRGDEVVGGGTIERSER